jgi:hypothetical protein
MEITIVDRLKSEICLTLDSTFETHLRRTGARHRHLKQRSTLQSNATSPATQVLEIAEANSRHSTFHFALINK